MENSAFLLTRLLSLSLSLKGRGNVLSKRHSRPAGLSAYRRGSGGGRAGLDQLQQAHR